MTGGEPLTPDPRHGACDRRVVWKEQGREMMIGKIVRLPFWLVGKLLGTALGLVKLIVLAAVGAVRFLFSHVLGSVIGATIGLLLGKRHVGVKLFSGRKKKKVKPVKKD